MNNVKHFKKIARELGELYEVKDRAYGSSFADTYKKLGYYYNIKHNEFLKY